MSDILDLDLATADINFPCIRPGIYDVKLTESDIKENDAKTWMQTFETVGPSESDKGEPLEPGQKVFNTLNLVPTGKAKNQNIVMNVGEFVQSLASPLGWTIRRIMNGHKELEGQVVKARVGIQAAGNDRSGVYRKARNVIEGFIKP